MAKPIVKTSSSRRERWPIAPVCSCFVPVDRMREPRGEVKMLAAAAVGSYLTIATMKANLRYWTSVLREAERELDAAKTITAMRAAASKLMTAKVKVKRLQKVPAVEA
jgi:hypothetical protein